MMTRQSWCFNDFNLSWITTISGLPPAGFRPPAPHSRPSSLTIHRVSQTMYNVSYIRQFTQNTSFKHKYRKSAQMPKKVCSAFQENTKCAWKRKIWGSVLLPSNVSESRVSRKLAVSRNLGNNSRALCATVLCCVQLCNCATVNCATVRLCRHYCRCTEEESTACFVFLHIFLIPWNISCFKKFL